MAKGVLAVRGARALMMVNARAERQTRLANRAILKTVGTAVQIDAAARIAPVSRKTATGFKTSVTQKGISVYQSRASTGKHPEFGRMVMRCLLIARNRNTAATERAYEQALDRICSSWEQGGGL
jgi:hypothetical protein